MKKLIFITLFSCFLSCNSNEKFTLGFTPAGMPFSLSISSNGQPSIHFKNSIKLPIGSFSIGDDQYIQNHRTYIELISRNDNRKYVFEMIEQDEEITWQTNKYTINTVRNRMYSTFISVESEEISNVLHKRESPSTKPHFPEQPFSYFYISKKVYNNVNWEIHNLKDLVADIILGIVWFFAAIVDICLIIAFFILRFIWWIILLLIYLCGF